MKSMCIRENQSYAALGRSICAAQALEWKVIIKMTLAWENLTMSSVCCAKNLQLIRYAPVAFILALVCAWCSCEWSFTGAQPSSMPAKSVTTKMWVGRPIWSPDMSMVAVRVKGQVGTQVLASSDYHILFRALGFAPTWSPNSKFLAMLDSASSPDSNVLNILNTRTGELVKQFEIGDRCVTQMSWSPDGTKLLVAGNRLQLIDRTTLSMTTIGEQVSQLPWRGLAWSPDGKYFASCSGQFMRLFRDGEMPELQESASARYWDGSPGRISWSPDGKLLAFASKGFLHLLNGQTGQLLRKIETIQSRPAIFAFSPASSQFGYMDAGKLHICNLSTEKEDLQISAPANGGHFCWSSDGTYILVSCESEAGLYQAKGGRSLGFLDADHKQSYFEIAANSRDLVRSSDDKVDFISIPQSTASISPWREGGPRWESMPNPKSMNDCCRLLDASLTFKEKERLKSIKKVSDLHGYGGGSIMINSAIAKRINSWGTGYLEKEYRASQDVDSNDTLMHVLRAYWSHLKHKD